MMKSAWISILLAAAMGVSILPAAADAHPGEATPREFIYVLKPARLEMVVEGPNAEEARITAAHSAYLEKLTAAGSVLLYGRTQNNDENTFGIVVFTAGSEPEARRIMENDPAVSGGIMKASLYPYRVAYLKKG